MKLISLLIVVLICYTLLFSGVALAYDGFGVTVGDTFSFSHQLTAADNKTNLLPEEDNWLFDLEEIRVTIIGVIADFDVVFNQTWILGNGTELTSIYEEGWSDRSPYNYAYFFYPSNLTTIESFGMYGHTCMINETILSDYNGVERETNHLDVIFNNLGDYPVGYDEHYNVYFDKATGVTTELHRDIIEVGNSTNTVSIIITLQETSVWIVPEFPSLLILFISMIVIGVIIVFGKSFINSFDYHG